MQTHKSKIKGDAKMDWAYELENRVWVSKRDIQTMGGNIGDEVEYTYTKDEKGFEKVETIISVSNPLKNYIADLSKGYYDNENHVRECFIWHGYPETFINKIKNERMNFTQLRKYFDLVNRIKRKIDIKKDLFIKNDLVEISTLLEYDSGKKDSKISYTFKTIIDENLNKVIQGDDMYREFSGFYEHFKAILAYAKNSLNQ